MQFRQIVSCSSTSLASYAVAEKDFDVELVATHAFEPAAPDLQPHDSVQAVQIADYSRWEKFGEYSQLMSLAMN